MQSGGSLAQRNIISVQYSFCLQKFLALAIAVSDNPLILDHKVILFRAAPTMASEVGDLLPEEVHTAAELLPAVYAELRRLAGYILPPGQTLQPTALVHEAFLRMVGQADQSWRDQPHFFRAAAQAMRNIIVDQARRKARLRHGGMRQRLELHPDLVVIVPPTDEILALNESLQILEVEEPRLAEIVLLRYFTGLTVEETARALGLSPRTVKRNWRFARAWLTKRLQEHVEV